MFVDREENFLFMEFSFKDGDIYGECVGVLLFEGVLVGIDSCWTVCFSVDGGLYASLSMSDPLLMSSSSVEKGGLGGSVHC